MSSPESSVLEEVSVSLANLSEESRQNVIEAVEFAEATHTSDELDVRQVVQDAEAADYHRAQADEYQQLQSKAVSDGNWEEARDYAAKAQGELEAVADHGGTELPAVEAEQDVTNLDNARWEQRQANDNARSASSYAEAGDSATAQVYAQAADHHQVLADESGHDGLAGAREAHADDADSVGTRRPRRNTRPTMQPVRPAMPPPRLRTRPRMPHRIRRRMHDNRGVAAAVVMALALGGGCVKAPETEIARSSPAAGWLPELAGRCWNSQAPAVEVCFWQTNVSTVSFLSRSGKQWMDCGALTATPGEPTLIQGSSWSDAGAGERFALTLSQRVVSLSEPPFTAGAAPRVTVLSRPAEGRFHLYRLTEGLPNGLPERIPDGALSFRIGAPFASQDPAALQCQALADSLNPPN